MKSRIVNLFDYNTLEIPDELKKWHYPDDEIYRELDALSADKAEQIKVNGEIIEGDCVKCRCVKCAEMKWSKRSILLYPGRNIPGAEDAEKEILGHKIGDEIVCTVGEWEMTLLAAEAVRNVPAKVDDAFAKSLGIAGVESVSDYMRWYRGQHDAERKTKKSYEIIHYWLDQTARHSVYEIDEEEKRQWCMERGKVMFEGMLAAGYDMRIPSDGLELLTDEQAIEKEAREQERNFIPFMIIKELSRKDGFEVTDEDYQKVISEAAAKQGLTMEEAYERSCPSLYYEMAYKEHVFLTLSPKAMECMED